MRCTSRFTIDNFHSAGLEMSKSNFPGIDTSITSSKALLIDERGDVMSRDSRYVRKIRSLAQYRRLKIWTLDYMAKMPW